jgi:hypothetical protein
MMLIIFAHRLRQAIGACFFRVFLIGLIGSIYYKNRAKHFLVSVSKAMLDMFNIVYILKKWIFNLRSDMFMSYACTS